MAALTFTTSLDDAQFQAALARMQGKAKTASASIGNSLSSAINSMSGGGPAFAALGRAGVAGGVIAAVAGTLYGVANAGDEAAQSIHRINASVEDMQKSVAIFEELKKLSAQTGSEVGDSASQFTRFAIAARQIGASNSDIVKLISLVQKAGVVSGATGAELSAATTQLGQALASGRFQGDELRSIMENMPILAEALAKKLGVSIGQLREMGKEGQLTTEKVFPALLEAADEIDAKFGKIPVSMGKAWTAFTQQASASAAALDAQLGASKNLSKFLQFITGTMSGEIPLISSGAVNKSDAASGLPSDPPKMPGDKRGDETMAEYKERKKKQPRAQSDIDQEQETREDRDEKVSQFELEMQEQQKEEARKYMSIAEQIRSNEERIAHLKEMAVGNDRVRTAELNKQISSLQAQTLELRVQQNLMSPDERRQQQRDKNRLDRATSKAKRQVEQEGREMDRKDWEQGLPKGTTRMKRQGDMDLKPSKVAPMEFSEGSVTKLAKAIAAENAVLLTK